MERQARKCASQGERCLVGLPRKSFEDSEVPMADSNLEGKKPAETRLTGLDADASAVEKLGKALMAAVKSRAFGRPEYGKQIEEARRLANQVDWEGLKDTIEREAGEVREREETGLRSRREKLLQAASAAQWQAQQGGQYDRIDIFQVEYEGATAVVKLGGVPCERVKEVDGEKLFARLKQLKAVLEQAPFQREAFFRQLKGAYGTCRRTSGTADEFVPVRELHREMVLERARNSERFRKSGEAKSIEGYSLPQFIFDLARFLRGGVTAGEERIVTQVPSMRESREAIHIPNLEHPTSSEVTAARLAIKAA